MEADVGTDLLLEPLELGDRAQGDLDVQLVGELGPHTSCRLARRAAPSASRSSRTTSVMPSSARCQAVLAPMAPPPITTTSAESTGTVRILPRPGASIGLGRLRPCTVGPRPRELATARRVLVTGATGFLGRHLIPLLTARGDDVVALVRPSADAAWLEDIGVRVVRGELLAGDAIGAATGVELVFHVAGRVSHEPRELSRLREINVGGLGRVLEAAPGGARVVHVSSVAAVGPAPGPDQAATETQLFPEWALRYPYAATKREGEAVAFAAAEAGRDVVIACPGFLLGPGDVYGISTWPVRRYLDGTLRIHEPGGLSHVDARDVAAGLLVLAERGRAGERTILTTRDGNLSHEDLFREGGEITGVRRRMVGLHPRVAALGARLVPWPVKPGGSGPPPTGGSTTRRKPSGARLVPAPDRRDHLRHGRGAP